MLHLVATTSNGDPALAVSPVLVDRAQALWGHAAFWCDRDMGPSLCLPLISLVRFFSCGLLYPVSSSPIVDVVEVSVSVFPVVHTSLDATVTQGRRVRRRRRRLEERLTDVTVTPYFGAHQQTAPFFSSRSPFRPPSPSPSRSPFSSPLWPASASSTGFGATLAMDAAIDEDALRQWELYVKETGQGPLLPPAKRAPAMGVKRRIEEGAARRCF